MSHYDRVNILCATKGRSAKSLPTFVASALEKAEDKSKLLFTFCLNVSDKSSESYLRGAIAKENLCIVYENEKECNLSIFYNKCYNETTFKDNSVAVGFFGDDMVFVTKNWDRPMLSKLNDSCGYGIIYGDDDYVQHDMNCVYFLVSRKLVDATGLPYVCPHFKVDWIDTIWYEIGKRLNLLEYIPSLHVAHRHGLSPDVGMDIVAADMRRIARTENRDVARKDEYIETAVANIKKHFEDKYVSRTNLRVVMTTYDRIYLLKKTIASIGDSVVRPKSIYVYDDGSVRQTLVRKTIPESGYTYKTEPHVGCEKHHKRMLDEVFSDKKVEYAFVVDSDAALYKYWFIKVCEMTSDVMPDTKAIIGSVFNLNDRKVDDKAPDGYEFKSGCGGLGMVIHREALKYWLKTEADERHVGWDNYLCTAANKAGEKVISTISSYIQHTGFIDGVHANARYEENVTGNFCGIIHEEQTDRMISRGDRILVSCMAYKEDMIYAAVIVNAFIDDGVIVRWVTIPHNVRIIECLATDAGKIVVEPLSGIPKDTYCELTTYKMQEMYPGYDAYLNLQLSARENSGMYRNSELPKLEWLKQRARKKTVLPLAGGEKRTAEAVKRIVPKGKFNRVEGMKNVLVTCYSEENIYDEKYIDHLWRESIDMPNYNCILLSNEPAYSIRGRKDKHFSHQEDDTIVGIVNNADIVVGTKSWVTALASVVGKVTP